MATILIRDMRDPRMGFLTITRVKVSKDLETATIYYSVLGDDKEKRQAARVLDHATAFIQREVGGGLATRTAPRIHFEYDESVEGTVKITNLLSKIATERKARVGDDDDEAQTSADEAPQAGESRAKSGAGHVEPEKPAPTKKPAKKKSS